MHPRYYRLLHYFVETVKAGSVTSAAAKLHVSAPVVSQALTDLEQRLSVSLLQRSARRFSLTETGAAVYEQAKLMMQAANSALAVVEPADAKIRGHLTITMPTEVAMCWLPDYLLRFSQRYPEIDITAHADDEMIELAHSDIEIAIRGSYLSPYSESDISSVVERTSNPQHVIPLVLAARRDQAEEFALLARQGEPLPFVGFSRRQNNHSIRVSSAGRPSDIRMAPQITVNNGLLVRQLCQQGVGAALLLDSTLDKSDDTDRGLVPVLPEMDCGRLQMTIVYRDVLPRRAALLLAEQLFANELNLS